MLGSCLLAAMRSSVIVAMASSDIEKYHYGNRRDLTHINLERALGDDYQERPNMGEILPMEAAVPAMGPGVNERGYQHRFESSSEVNATPQVLFAELDNHQRLSEHMMQSSPMMAGSKMHFDFDARGGRAIGSKIQMSGRMFGIQLWLEEVITEREPPSRKVWETVGKPRLLVIGDYRMGFEIEALGGRSKLTVFICYDDPGPPWTMLGKTLGPVYARWCAMSIARGAAQRFAA